MKTTLYTSLEPQHVFQTEIERLLASSREAMRVQEPNESIKALLKAYKLAKQSGEKARIQQIANALQNAYRFVVR